MRDRTRELTGLRVRLADRSKGFGTTLVHKVCRDADTQGIVLVLWPRRFDDGPMDDARLEAWYAERFGFQVLQREPEVLMARMPGSTPRLLGLTPTAEAIALARGLG